MLVDRERGEMSIKYPKMNKLLMNGGTCYVNKLGSHWCVDVFDADWHPNSGLESVYHAFYDTEQEAMADMNLWQGWPESV